MDRGEPDRRGLPEILVLSVGSFMFEVEMVADHLIIINRGRVVRETEMSELAGTDGKIVAGRLEELFFELTSPNAQVRS